MALSNEDKKDVAGAFGKKAASAVSRATHDGFDSKKMWGNSAIKGHGVNSPAMMEARKGFAKKAALDKKIGKGSAAGINAERKRQGYKPMDAKRTRIHEGMDKYL